MGLFAMSVFTVHAIPVQMSGGGAGGGASIKYPINIACECIFTLYVDGIYVGEGNKENYDPVNWPFGISEWNNTKKYYPVIYENQPKIVAFNGIGDEYTVFKNGFIMDMNNGMDYTKYKEWKCKDFSKTVEKTPPANWFSYDYDDSGWDISTSYGANYQNNSFQMFESPRDFISLNAEWLWTKDNADANIYCRKKNMDTVMLTSTPLLTTTVVPPPMTTSSPVTTTVPNPPVSTTVAHSPVSSTIHHHMQTNPHITSTTVHPPMTTQIAHPPVSTTVAHPPVSTTVAHPPVSTTVAHLPVSTTVAPMITHITHPPVSTTVAHSPVSTTVAHPPVSTTVAHPPVSTTVAHSPVSTTVAHPPVSTTVAHPPVSSTIHHHMQTNPHITSTAVHPPMTTQIAHPPVSTTIAHSPVSTTVAHPPVSTTIHHIPHINIKIIINNIKYSQGVSDKQLVHLIENVKLYNNPQYQSKYRNDHFDNNNLYIKVLNARLDLIRHYQILLHHLEHLEHLEHDYNISPDEYTDYKIPRHSSYDSTYKSNIIQSMITLNSHIKHIEDSIHFIKGNHKYLLLHILKNLKQQYKEDTMKIFNI
jgi:hypothetical protein